MTAVLPRVPAPAPEFRPPVGLPKPGSVRFVDVPERRCLAIDGSAAPSSEAFQAAVGALYTTAYTLHFLLKDRGVKAPVGALEGLWERADGGSIWHEAGAVTFDVEGWRWTLVIPMPDDATDEDLVAALATARRRRPSPDLEHVRLRVLHEGHAIEALHVGPYATEPETIGRMREAAEAAGLVPSGPHHEIYLGDPRRTASERLRTVLRQPLR